MTARRGSALIYGLLSMSALLGMATFAVDFGRTSSVRAELQDVTDAAARYAARGMKSTMLDQSGAGGNASAVFAETPVDGTTVAFNPNTDMTLGIWNSVNKTFTPASLSAGANSVRITTSLTMGDAAHPLYFLSIFNRQVTLHARSIAMITGTDASTYVSGKGNPWLAGTSAGTLSNNFRTAAAEQDYAGTGPNDMSSPAMINLASLNATSGSSIMFDGVTGGSMFGTGTTITNADGNPSLTCNLGSPAFGDYSYFTSSMNGMSNCHAPVNALMAVFLSDSSPTSGATPSPLDFRTAASRDYVSLSPQLKQVFFVGDGRRSNGEIQQIVVPPGATRLFIANMDGWQYNNNLGGFNLTIHATQKVSSVYLR